MAKVFALVQANWILLEISLAKVEVPSRASGGQGAFSFERNGLIGLEVGLELGVDGADVGGAHGRHGEEAVFPLAQPGHALVEVKEAGEGRDHLGLDAH